jgi:predicted metal-dependent hydrolase
LNFNDISKDFASRVKMDVSLQNAHWISKYNSHHRTVTSFRNLELAKKPLHCIEYIVVHEMVHLLERNHNDKFIACMNQFLPEWKHLKNELNRLPISHVDWAY